MTYGPLIYSPMRFPQHAGVPTSFVFRKWNTQLLYTNYP